MKRYSIYLVVRPECPTERDYSIEQQTRCNVTAKDEVHARRKVIHRSAANGYLVSYFLSIEVGREV